MFPFLFQSHVKPSRVCLELILFLCISKRDIEAQNSSFRVNPQPTDGSRYLKDRRSQIGRSNFNLLCCIYFGHKTCALFILFCIYYSFRLEQVQKKMGQYPRTCGSNIPVKANWTRIWTQSISPYLFIFLKLSALFIHR